MFAPTPVASSVLLSPLFSACSLTLFSPLIPLRSTCTCAATAARTSSATSFGSSSSCPSTPLTHGSASSSSPTTSTTFTLARCGTATKVSRAQVESNQRLQQPGLCKSSSAWHKSFLLYGCHEHIWCIQIRRAVVVLVQLASIITSSFFRGRRDRYFPLTSVCCFFVVYFL